MGSVPQRSRPSAIHQVIASPSSGYYEVTYVSEDSGCTTSLGTVYVTIDVDPVVLANQLADAVEKLEELYEPEAKQAERERDDRPAPRPVTISSMNGRNRPRPIQLTSTFG